MRSRGVLLPFTGDCFLLKKWLECFDKWQDEVDKLYVMINADVHWDTYRYCTDLLSKYNAKILVEMHMIDHGPALNKLLDVCTEDLVLLIEEDGFIFKKGQVDKCFKLIESREFDIMGSERGSTTEEIIRVASRRFGCEYPGFWPNFFFCKKEDLLKTNRHFQAMTWYRGDKIIALAHIIEDEIAPADTFVWASLQLRNMGLKVKLVPQYHSVIEDIQDHTQIKGIFDREAPWIHIGSLSGWQNVLLSANLAPRLGEVAEWGRRAAAWLLFWEDAQPVPDTMTEFSSKYRTGIMRLIDEYTLSFPQVNLRTNLYRQLLK
jgi:hypothetical protein